MPEDEKTVAPVDTVIRNATVLTETTPPSRGDDTRTKATATFLDAHAIGISAGEIAWILPDAAVPPAAIATAIVLDGTGCAAIPGMINCHSHSPMTMFRGSAEDVPTERWFNDYIWPMEVNITDDDVELGARLAVGEMLLSGVTTFADHYFATDRIARVVRDTGARALLASTFFSTDGAEGRDRSAAFAAEWNGAADGRIATALGPHATYTVDDAGLAATAELARDLGVRIHVHAAESMKQTTSSLRSRGVTPVQVLHDTGVLDAGALIAHGTGIIADDVPFLTPFSDRIGVACSAKGYLKHAHSTTPIRLLHEAGIDVGVATDGPASHNTLDMFEAVRFLSLVQKEWTEDATWLTSPHALDLLFRQSARVVGMAGRIGALLPGHRADVVLVDLSGPHLQPIYDLASALVLSVKSTDVRDVLVDGRIVVRDRRLTTFDLSETISELLARVPEISNRTHGNSIQSYAP